MHVLAYRCVEHQHVEAAKTLEHRINHGAHLRGVGHIRGVGLGVRAQCLDLAHHTTRLFHIRTRVDRHLGAARRQ